MKSRFKDGIERVALVCTACNFVLQPARGYPKGLWARFDREGRWPPTWRLECTNCKKLKGGVLPVTVHFVDTVHA